MVVNIYKMQWISIISVMFFLVVKINKLEPIRKLVIEAVNNSEENKYIQFATLNGRALDRPWFSQEDIKNGACLTFQMRPEPNKNWGAEADDAPPSVSRN
jgi:putative alpha-1,2-mannosidase